MPYADPRSVRARASHRKSKKKWRDKNPLSHPSRQRQFIGVDGEGGGKDSFGRQNYLLLRIGDDLLFNDNKPLRTMQCLAFMCSLPRDKIYVSYFFDYDVTMILRDLSDERRRKLLAPRGKFFNRYIDWHGFQIDYMPRKYFKVRRDNEKAWFTISDTGTFFQCSFLDAIRKWNIGTPEARQLIAKGKALRKTFIRMDDAEIEYNALEVRLLADLLEAFRSACYDIGLFPRQWQGPGYLAVSMMQKHGIPRRKELKLPSYLLQMANDAFYGGRFEAFRIGSIRNCIGRDINSAYPFAMQSLPCLLHGHWTYQKTRPKCGLWLGQVTFTKRNDCVCDLPIRTKAGTIVWPKSGKGIYWSIEVEAAERAGTKCQTSSCWVYEKGCDCVPFDWVKEVYEERKRLGKADKGIVLKLGLNSQYGKLAQSIGSAPYSNPIWASLITAHTRAKIIDAYRTVPPESLVMIATDGLFTTKEPDVIVSDKLGDWEGSYYEELFVIQPGLYFGGKRAKTRGVGRSFLESKEQDFRKQWQLSRGKFTPVINVPVRLFVGLKLASARNKPETAGQWIDTVKHISFDWSKKRAVFARWKDGNVITKTQDGSRSLKSIPYRKIIGAWKEEAELSRMELQAMPDFSVFHRGG